MMRPTPGPVLGLLGMTAFFLGLPGRADRAQDPQEADGPQEAQEGMGIEPPLFLTRDTTLKSHAAGGVYVGFAGVRDAATGRHPASPAVTLAAGADVRWTLYVYNASRVSLRGGSLGYGLTAKDDSAVTVTGGDITEDLSAMGRSRVLFSGGRVYGQVSAGEGSTVTITGGEIAGEVRSSDRSRVLISGGRLGAGLAAFHGGTFELYGTGLSKTLVNAHAEDDSASVYRLYGRLRDGVSIEGKTVELPNGESAHLRLHNGALPPAAP